MPLGRSNNFHSGGADSAIEFSAEGWISQASLWARASGAISLLAGGAILLLADWNVNGMPVQFYIALVWAGPAIIYFTLSFFFERLQGNICAIAGYFAAAHAIATLIAPLVLMAGYNPMAALIQPVFIGDSSDTLPWYYLLAVALCAGLGNLIVSAFWARRAIRQPATMIDGRRGFEIVDSAKSHLISSDLEK
jgi:hypothetical protein